MNILLVEDNPHDALFASKVLENYEMSITHVGTSEAGFTMLEEQKFDVAIFDLGLPDSDGVDSLREICRKLPVVVLTSNDNFEMALKAIKFGVQDYILKDQYSDDTLRRTVQYARERYLRLQLELENEKLRQQVMSKLTAISRNMDSLQKQLRD